MGPPSDPSTAPEMTSKHSRYFVTPLSAERGASGQTQRRYHYHDIAPPAGVPQKATVLLLHGFPDTAAGWFRITSPLSMSGYRLLIPDCLGYGLTSKPDLATRLHEYSFKSMVHDLCDLLDHAKAGQGALYGSDTLDAATGKNGRVIVVGHDWGAVLAWNFARFRIDRMLGVAALAVPYPAPTSKYIDINDLVKLVPSFGYQAFFAEPRSTALIEKNLDRFLAVVFSAPGLFNLNGKADDPHAPIINTEWVTVGKLEKQLTASREPSPTGGRLLNEKDHELIVRLFRDGGMEGPLNWYRTRKINFDEAQGLPKGLPADLPALFIQPDLDAALPPAVAKSMPGLVPSVKIEVVKNCGHWVQLENPSTTELAIRRWIEQSVFPQADAKKGVIGWIKSKI